MTFSASGLGEILDLAKAIGIVSASDQLNTDWFAHPDVYARTILRDQGQRDALLRALDGVLGRGGPPVTGEDGRAWVPVVREGPVSVFLVIQTEAAGVHLGVGAEVATTAPVTRTRARVPLVYLPIASPAASSGPLEVALGSARGRVYVESDLTFDAGISGPRLGGLRATLDVPTNGGADVRVGLKLRGLQLPGQSAPHDVDLDFSGADPGPSALRLLTGLLQQLAGEPSSPAAQILGLLGLSTNPALPPLPVAQLLEVGPAALGSWLESVVAHEPAMRAWLGHLVALLPGGAALAAGSSPYRVSWTLAPSGVPLGVTARVTRPTTGALTVELGLDARWSGGAGRVELDVGIVRFTLGSSPSLLGLPGVSLAARLTGASGTPLTGEGSDSLRVGSIRVGFAIDDQRRPAFVLGAHDVRLLGQPYAFLDLTNPQTLVDVGSNAVSSLASQALAGLGSAGDAVRVLSGLGAPAGAADWPVGPISWVDFLRDPAGAIAGYHRALLSANRGRYDEVLGALRGLLAVPGAPPAVLGDGTAERPWRVVLTAGGPGPVVALIAWTSGATVERLHVGLRVEAEVADLGGGCPRVEIDAGAELVRIGFGVPSAAFPSVTASVGLGARGRVPIELGDEDAGVLVDRVGVRFRLEDGRFGAELEAPNLRVRVGEQTRSIALPHVDGSGAFSGAVPWDAIELLAGHLLARTRLPALERLAALLGWMFPTARVRLSLERLIADPLREALRFAGDWAGREGAGWLSMLVGGPAGAGATLGILHGRGDRGSPLAIPLAARGQAVVGRAAELVLWPSRGGDVDALRPSTLMAGATGALAPTAEHVAQAMTRAILASEHLDDLLDDRADVAPGLAGLLTFWAGGDGRVPASAATWAGATAHDLPLAHGELAAAIDLLAISGRPRDRGTVFVTLEADWPGLAADRVLALDAASLPPEAFDVARARGEDGPWCVRLPRRAHAVANATQDAVELQAQRLERALAAVFARTGAPLQVVALSGAGHAALRAANRGTQVSHLVTVGTAHGPLDLSLVEADATGGALSLLGALLPAADAARPELPSVRRGRAIVEALASVARDGLAGDLLAPAPPPAIRSGLTVHCVRGVLEASMVAQAISGVVVRGLQAAAEAPRPDDPGLTRIGLGLRHAPAAAAGAVRVATEARLALFTLGSTSVEPEIQVRVTLSRAGRWLAGGPGTGTPRGPSVRRAVLELDLPLARPAQARARVVLHEVEALGLRRARWDIGAAELGADGLVAEARVLIGRVLAALGPATSSGPAHDLLRALASLGLIEATSATGAAAFDARGVPVVGQTLGLSVEAVQRALIDPAGFLASARATLGDAAIARAIAGLLGAPVPTGSRVEVTLDGLRFSADLAARSFTVATVAPGLTLDAGLVLRGELTVDASGPRGHLSVAFGAEGGPSGRAAIELHGAPLRADLVLEGGPSSLPARVSLWPTIDVAGVRRVFVATLPAQLLWAGVTFLRTLAAGAVALVDPMLRLFGLLDGTRVRVPVGLLAAPGEYLMHSATLGASSGALDAAKLGAAIDAIAAILGLSAAPSGGWQLPYGASLVAGPRSDGRGRIALGLDRPVASTGLRVGGTVGLVLPRNDERVEPDLTLRIALPGGADLASAPRLEAHVGGDGFSLALHLGSGVISLVPLGARGLESLGTAAITYALPYALDALAGLPVSNPARPVGQAIALVGDALQLKNASGGFSAAEIQSLAANPGPELARRLSSNPSAAFGAIAALVQPALPAGLTVTAPATSLVVARTGRFSVTITAPSVSAIRVSAAVEPIAVLEQATLQAQLTVDATGLVRAFVRFATPVATPLALGPVRLAPFAEIDLGSSAVGGAHTSVGLAIDATRSLAAVMRFAPSFSFALEPSAPAALAEALTLLVVPIAADVALSVQPVRELLARNVLGGISIGALLENVALTAGPTRRFDAGILDPAQTWPRLLRLGANIAQRAPALTVDVLTLRIASRTAGAQSFFGLSLSLTGGRLDIPAGDLVLSIEVDDAWINAAGNPGLTVEVLRVDGTTPAPHFRMALRGLGLRVRRASGPLLDTFIKCESVALHGYFAADLGGVTGAGGQIELGGLVIDVAEASGGSNTVAQGVLRSSAAGQQRPAPALSPALSLQREGSGDLQVDLRAGAGDGPWWITIQRGFGPVYLEQVGFGVTKENHKVVAARVLIDGRVTLLGLRVAVDDLSLGARWPQQPSDPPLYDPRAWEVGLAGLAISAETGGVTLSGGLSKAPGPLPDYVGTVTIRFGVYGLSAFGGYAVVREGADEYTSLFLFGALNAPLGGPPMFFVTGIGAGVGVNRLLRMPTMETLPAYPLVRALDRNTAGAPTPTELRAAFPPERGTFWFAAGVSFTSFTLVEAVAVLGIQIGDGLDINLLGLARAGLPNPAAPLVSLELALLARFSTREGVLWIQAQLTDNSWLLTRDCRLTGGFAFVSWFKGPHAGEFVVTIGGYHPSFHREGYPVVPRLGFVWTVSSVLLIKGESYFALTSEAIMAGARLEARLEIGPLWAYLRLGADGIVYFDPFAFEVSAFAELGAGITIDIDLGWLGHIRITVSIKLHANVLLMGPDFRGRAEIDLGVATAAIEFGDWNDRSTPKMPGGAFVTKYLQAQGARALSATPGVGQVAPKPTSGGAAEPKPATGVAGDPFLFLPEFELCINTTGAVSSVFAARSRDPAEVVELGIGPMFVDGVTSRLSVRITGPGDVDWTDRVEWRLQWGSFPKAVWAVLPADKKVPEGEVIRAISGVVLVAQANPSPGGPPIAAHQVEAGPRKPLPFLAEAQARAARAADMANAEALAAEWPRDPPAIYALAAAWLATGALASPQPKHARLLAAASRRAPPELAALTAGMAAPPLPPVRVLPREKVAAPRAPHRFTTPRLIAVLAPPPSAAARPRRVTSVGEAFASLPRVAPPTLAEVRRADALALGARLVVAAPTAQVVGHTVLPSRLPHTDRAGSGRELGAGRTRDRARLAARGRAVDAGQSRWAAGEIAVLELADASRDRSRERPRLELDAPARVVAIDGAGACLLDRVTAGGQVVLPPRTARVALIPGAGVDDSAGWHSGAPLVQLHPSALLGSGCVLRVPWKASRRGVREVSTGLVSPIAHLTGDVELTTRFSLDPRSIAILLEHHSGEPSPDDLDLALTGARRARDRGRLIPPRILVAGARLAVVYAVERDAQARAVEVSVFSSDKLRIAGVIASARDVHALAADVARASPASLCGALIHDPQAVVGVTWTPPPADGPKGPPHPDVPVDPRQQRAR